jgi:hypothetical protein
MRLMSDGISVSSVTLRQLFPVSRPITFGGLDLRVSDGGRRNVPVTGKPARTWFPGAAPLVCGLVVALGGGGCAFGPKALERTHGRYNEAVNCVEEEQLLRNIVRMRYNETPSHLSINSIAAQYELAGTAEARPFFIAPNPSNSNIVFRTFTSILPDVSVSGANRPTVTLDPADSSDAVRQFLTPIPLDTLIFLAQSSWPVSTVLRLWVERLNGVPNAATGSGPPRDVPPDFARFLRAAELFQVAQDRELASVRAEERVTEVGGPLPADAITAAAAVEAARSGLEYRRGPDGKSWVLVRRERRLVVEVSPGAENSPEIVELTGLLNLVPGQPRYDITVAARGAPDPARFPTPPSAELSVVPRSTAQVLFYLANGVEVPPEHVCAGLVRPALDAEGHAIGPELTRGLFEVHVAGGHRPPPTAFVPVKYRGYWYYIDDRDQASKATFALVLQLGRLDFAREPLRRGPVLTLPAGR